MKEAMILVICAVTILHLIFLVFSIFPLVPISWGIVMQGFYFASLYEHPKIRSVIICVTFGNPIHRCLNLLSILFSLQFLSVGSRLLHSQSSLVCFCSGRGRYQISCGPKFLQDCFKIMYTRIFTFDSLCLDGPIVIRCVVGK